MARQANTPKGPSQRQLSVGEKVRHALTEALQRGDLRDPLLERAVVTVSEVRMSPDLKLATAYITVLGQADAHAKYLRGRLSPALLQMKYMPEVRFREDDSFDNYARIDALLRSPDVLRDLEETEGDDDNKEER